MISIIGPPGPGKSYVLRESLRRALFRCKPGVTCACTMCGSGKCCGKCGMVVELSALAGVRAADFDSCNLYVLFGYRPVRGKDGNAKFTQVSFWRKQSNMLKRPWILQYLRHLEVLLIDEICFVGMHLMHAINLTLQWVKGNAFAFGNVLIVATGDHYQIPPIDDDPLLEDDFFQALFLPVVLQHCVRSQCPYLTELQSICRNPIMSVAQSLRALEIMKMCPQVSLLNLPPNAPLLLARKDPESVQSLLNQRVALFAESIKVTFTADDTSCAPGRSQKRVGNNDNTDKNTHDFLTRRCHVPYENTVTVGGLATVRANLADPQKKRNMQLFNGSLVQIEAAAKMLWCRMKLDRLHLFCHAISNRLA